MARDTHSCCDCNSMDTTKAYRTLAGRGTAVVSIQGSEFIGHASPVTGQVAAETFVETIRENHSDATHNVPAYRVHTGTERRLLREYSSDDGEPSGSAGKPVLNVLQGQELENAAVVVTRHFGGTELGVGGLVRAYSRVTTQAIDAAGTIDTVPHEELLVTVDYDDSGTVRGTLESAGVEFEATYEEQVAFDVRVPVADSDDLCDRLQSATSGRAKID
ncbi:IMPACT family protein [Halocatena salina]|uniref:IMPACT family protein n=1 Tax=Halocatena salina TaxID=2934340 RepID=A0A8T9ZZN7_9EURY|nr:YigZ family protein [Halocatena salina]UPM42234.1 IMPACT family protein [Halocatena salina]